MNTTNINASIVALFLLASAAPLAAQQEGGQGDVVAEEVPVTANESAGGESSTVDNLVEKSKELMDASAETAKKGWDKTKEVSGEVWEGTKEVSGDAWDKTKEVSGKAWEKTKEVSVKAVDASKETAAKVGAAAKAGYEAAKETYTEEGENDANATESVEPAATATE